MAEFKLEKSVQEKLEQSIINKLFGAKSPLPGFVDRILSDKIDLPEIINKVRLAIPTPQDGKNAEIPDEMLSDLVVKVLERTQELIQVKDGRDGPQGIQGDKGEKGDPGDRGLQGLKGISGEDGRDGRPGVSGPIGIQGEKGKQGIQGISGKAGNKGEKGNIGESGVDGKDFTISEEDFQSVVDRIDFTEFVPKKELDKVLKKLKSDIERGRLKVPFLHVGGGGMTPTEIVKAINDLLGTEDWQNGIPGDGTLPANLLYVQFTTDETDVPYSRGLLQYDEENETLSLYTDVPAFKQQIGQEVTLRGYNRTGSVILNGTPVYRITVGGEKRLIPADASSAISAISTIGLATHDVPVDTVGVGTTIGTLRDVDTTSFSEGDILYLAVGGGITNIMPGSPNYSIQLGNAGVIDANIGDIDVHISIAGNTSSVIKIFNGAILEDHSIEVSSNGSIVTLTLEKSGGGNLSLFFDGAFTFFDSDPAASVELTLGNDEDFTRNFVYIPKSTNILTSSTVGFPTTEQFVPIADVLVQSATGVQTDGCQKCHAWTDHLANSIGQGHLSHVNNWIRHQPATWISDVVPSAAIIVNGGAIDNVYYSNTSGNILQLHEHDFPSRDMETGDPIFIANDPNTAYRKTTDLSSADETSLGVTLRSNNTYYSIFVWGVISEGGTDSKIYGNLPSGSYANSVDAITDPLGFTNKTTPPEYTGTSFPIARLVLRYQTVASGTITEILTENLTGTGEGGGGSPTGGTEFSDNLFRILSVLNGDNEIAFDASGIIGLRTITMPDHDVDLGNVTKSTVKAIRTITSDDTFVNTDYTILIDASANTVDALLPASPTQGQVFVAFCIDATFACTIARNGNNINGAATDRTLAQLQSETYQFDNTYGWVIH